MLFQLNDKTKTSMSRTLGMDYDTLINMDDETIDSHIETLIGKKLSFDSLLGNMVNRGSMYVHFNRLFTRDAIDKGVQSIQ